MRRSEPTLVGNGVPLAERLAQAIALLPRDVFHAQRTAVNRPTLDQTFPAPDHIKPNAYALVNDQIGIREGDHIQHPGGLAAPSRPAHSGPDSRARCRAALSARPSRSRRRERCRDRAAAAQPDLRPVRRQAWSDFRARQHVGLPGRSRPAAALVPGALRRGNPPRHQGRHLPRTHGPGPPGRSRKSRIRRMPCWSRSANGAAWTWIT